MKIRPHSTRAFRMVTVSIFTVLTFALIPLGTINALTLKDVISTLKSTTHAITSPSSTKTNDDDATAVSTPSTSSTTTPAANDSSTSTTSTTAPSATTSVASSAQSATTTLSEEATSTVLTSSLSAASIKTASAQAAEAASATTYSSNKINQMQADQLYKFAASGAAIGLVIYAITLLPLQRNQRKALSFSQSQL